MAIVNRGRRCCLDYEYDDDVQDDFDENDDDIDRGPHLLETDWTFELLAPASFLHKPRNVKVLHQPTNHLL